MTHPKFDMTGIKRMDFAVLNTEGLPMGLAGLLANGADAGLYRLEGIKNADLSLGNPDLVNIVGDGRFQSVYLFPPGAARRAASKGRSTTWTPPSPWTAPKR